MAETPTGRRETASRANAEAIEAALRDIPELEAALSSVTDGEIVGHRVPYLLTFLARALARRSILAVDSLTDEQCAVADQCGHDETITVFMAGEWRAALRRCASGEPK
jgi:hypothetical protein